MTDDRVFVVADIGGTTLRIGRFAVDGEELSDVRRVPTAGLGIRPEAGGAQLQERVLAQLEAELGAYLRSPEGAGATAVGLSFAGPTTIDGIALAAPTVWGDGGAPVELRGFLERALGVLVLVANDITAAAWRYAATESEPFCLFTVSSGIGNKVFRHGAVLIDDAGFGGELGHWRVDPGPNAPPCDCGGRGHLGAIASGRGVLAAARRAASDRPAEFAASALAGPAGGRPEGITNEALAVAIRLGDAFGIEVLRGALVALASAVGCLFAAIGIRRYVFIGGFAIAIGDRFVEVLGDELVRLGCFGLDDGGARAMLTLGVADDDHSLIGIGRMLAHRQPAEHVPAWTKGVRSDAYADHR